ncbi:MAG: DNA primase [Clostridiales Family XIII bacterium]|nr:DNA primase [Clostridiales Family XIII bacterium]
MAEVTNIAEEIKERADIVSQIGRVVKLRKRGVLWEGLCPFHGEKTPSFKVYEDSQHYHCYGCGASGDVIDFCMKYYNLNFIEASSRLAEELNIDWKPGGKFDAESRRKEYYAINREAALYYHRALKAPGNAGYEYLAGRGILDETMTVFGLGYAAGGRDGLSRYLSEKGMPLEKAAEMTLIVRDGGGYKDRYFSRVMFPLMNVAGKVVGFSARTIDPKEKEKKIAKYINSSESDVFHKKDNLYALNRTKDAISASNRTAILVEGQMDVVSAWQHGVHNVTASLGTALTEWQAKLLKRFADHVVLAYDMDESGRDAALKGGEVLRAAGLEVRVMSLPSGKDPDEFLRTSGKDAFVAQAEAAMPYLEYRLTRLLGKHDLSANEGAVTFLKAAAEVLSGMSPVERDYYTKWLEEMTGISSVAIEAEAVFLGGSSSGSKQRGQERTAVRHGGSPVYAHGKNAADWVSLENSLIRLLVHDPAFMPDLRGRERDFTSPQQAGLFHAIVSRYEEAPGYAADVDELTLTLDSNDAIMLQAICGSVLIEDDPRRQLGNCLANLDIPKLEAQREQVIRTLNPLINEGQDSESIRLLAEEITEIDEKIRTIKERISG